mgnify:CR=1 FL=1
MMSVGRVTSIWAKARRRAAMSCPLRFPTARVSRSSSHWAISATIARGLGSLRRRQSPRPMTSSTSTSLSDRAEPTEGTQFGNEFFDLFDQMLNGVARFAGLTAELRESLPDKRSDSRRLDAHAGVDG